MESDDDTHFNHQMIDDVNNNHSIDHAINSESKRLDSFLYLGKTPKPISFNRRSIRSSTNRRSNNDSEHCSTPPAITNDVDPNVFLISSDTNSHNTIRKTKHDVKRFVMYIDEQFGEQMPLHTISAPTLCQYLKHYFENTKKFDGTQYEPDTLRSFLLSIERYLKSKNYQYNLMESQVFQSCRQVITNKREEWKKLGANNQSKTPTLASLNVKNINIFDRTKPDGLLLEIYVHMTQLCPSSHMSQLLWGNISLVNEQYLVYNQTKAENHTVRLYATPHQLGTCPVQAYRLYATHRPVQSNTPQSPFFLIPRSTNAHHVWYKSTAANKNLEHILQKAIQNLITVTKSISKNEQNSSLPNSNEKRHESTNNIISISKSLPTFVQPLNLSVTTSNEEDSATSSPSPTNSITNAMTSLSPIVKQTETPLWDDSVTQILLTIANLHHTRTAKINTLRSYLEEKIGFVEFLCLYRGFKSEPKLTFQGTPWEHYQRFLPVLFTLLTLENMTV